MNIHMKIFRSQRFDPLRVVMLDDEPWYIVADICRTLGYGNATKAVRLVRQEDKTIINVPNISVGSNPANAVNLSGLETLILRSRRREDAAAFSRWLADTVFPIVYDDDPEPKPQDPPKETADNDLFLVHRSDYLQHLKELEKLYTMLRDVNALVASIPGIGMVPVVRAFSQYCKETGDEILAGLGLSERMSQEETDAALHALMENGAAFAARRRCIPRIGTVCEALWKSSGGSSVWKLIASSAATRWRCCEPFRTTPYIAASPRRPTTRCGITARRGRLDARTHRRSMWRG